MEGPWPPVTCRPLRIPWSPVSTGLRSYLIFCPSSESQTQIQDISAGSCFSRLLQHQLQDVGVCLVNWVLFSKCVTGKNWFPKARGHLQEEFRGIWVDPLAPLSPSSSHRHNTSPMRNVPSPGSSRKKKIKKKPPVYHTLSLLRAFKIATPRACTSSVAIFLLDPRCLLSLSITSLRL